MAGQSEGWSLCVNYPICVVQALGIGFRVYFLAAKGHLAMSHKVEEEAENILYRGY